MKRRAPIDHRAALSLYTGQSGRTRQDHTSSQTTRADDQQHSIPAAAAAPGQDECNHKEASQ